MAKKSTADKLQKQVTDLAFATPAVVATRLTRMALAGTNPSRRDQREFSRMSSEKVLAFYSSWTAMWMEAAFMPWRMMSGTISSDPASDILEAGMKPIHKAAMANQRRLSRRR